MVCTLTKSILFLMRAFVKSLFKMSYLCTQIVGSGFLILKHFINGDILGWQKAAKQNFKQMASDFERAIDDVELFMWAALSLSKDFLTKENADRFASLGLFAFLITCVRALLKSLVT